MSLVLLIGFFMSLFLIVLLIGKKRKSQADKILFFMLMVYAIAIGGPFIEMYNRSHNFPYPHLMNNALMEKEQPYLDPEITLGKLSDLLQLKPEVLSNVLNSTLNQNFFDFMNKYRVDDFKIRCINKENQHLSIMGIAYECGFNSKAAFYRSFNKFEGLSPTAYILKVSK